MKKKYFILLGMVFCLFGVSACSTKQPSSGTYDKPKLVLKEELENAQQEEVEEVQENQEEQQEQNSETVYNIGDTANLKNWSITVTDMSVLNTIDMDFGRFTPSADDSQFLDVFVIATNNGKQADSFLSSFSMSDDMDAKLIYGDGYEFTASNLLGYDYDFHDSVINPLSSLTGEIVFEVPDIVSNSTEPLLIRFTCENKKVEFKIR